VTDPVISVDGMSKRYASMVALADVSFEVESLGLLLSSIPSSRGRWGRGWVCSS